MKKLVYPLCFFAFLSGNELFAQSSAFSNEFASVRTDLVSWDKVRGEWLAQSMEAMSNNQPVPDRNFPENFTPSQMFMAMPESVRSSVKTKIAQQSTSSPDSTARHQWSTVNQFVQRPTCTAVTGRTHGDPHLTSFDGAGYDFQTVGEFTLVKSQSGHMNVQVRQRAEGSSVSLNSAVAMWVNGDRVCFYSAGSGPDGNRTTPIRVDGEAVYTNNGIFFLNHGGTITQSKSEYIVTWPTGERVVVDQRGFGNGDFFNLAVEVFPCTDNYTGILGNANGRSSDDFDINGRSVNRGTFGTANSGTQVAEREYLSFLSQDFASNWRVTQPTSLFDYGFGQSTASFTDVTFPLVHQTINDLSQTDRSRAQRDCERQGFTGAALNACIYDNGFLRIPPTPAPSVPVVVVNPVVTPVVNPVPNVNPGGRLRNVGSTRNPVNPTTPNPNNPIGDTRNPNVSAPNGGTTTSATETKNPGVNSGNSGAQPIDQTTTGTSTKENSGSISSGTTTTATKQPNPYEPPIEPEKKRIRVGTTSSGQSSGTSSSGSSNSGSSSSGSSSSGSSSSSSSSSHSSGSSGSSVRTSVPHTTSSPKPVSTPAPAPKPVSTPKPAGGLMKKP